MSNTILEIENEKPKFEYEVTINYELIRDFTGEALTFLRYRVDHDYEIASHFIWNTLALVCLDEAIAEYCRDPEACNSNKSLRNVNDFGNRMKIFKETLMASLGEKAISDMLGILKNGWTECGPNEIHFAVGTVYGFMFHSPSGMSDPRLSIIVSALLYTNKYLAFKEYCNPDNSRLAREILIDVYNNSKAAVWDRKIYLEYWGSL